MKKLSFGLVILLVLFAGCKSAPAGRPVDALELIDSKSAFYIAVPRAADTALIERIITGFYSDASEADAKIQLLSGLTKFILVTIYNFTACFVNLSSFIIIYP